LAESPRVTVLTPLNDNHAGAIALFQVDGIDNVKLGQWLFNQHRIVNTPIVHAEFKGIRITPNVYTTLDEIDVFADKVLDAVKKGIPA
jgi:selenocysteine lyase/cysteine desulfurase